MEYQNVNDNELLTMVSESNEEAERQLIKKYTGIVYTIAKKYENIAQSLKVEEGDLVQEGFIGLSKAIDTYNSEKNVLFYTYVTVCIESNIKSHLRSIKNISNHILNNCISIEKLFEDESYNVNELLKDETYNPSAKLFEKEDILETIRDIEQLLAPFEKEVFEFKLNGYTNKEIAIKLGKNKRSIENTISRIKKKYKQANS